MNRQIMGNLGSQIMTCIVSGYLLSEINQTEGMLGELDMSGLLSSESGQNDSEYERWLTGGMSETYYSYSDKNIAKHPKNVQTIMKEAQIAYAERIKKEKETELAQLKQEEEKEVMAAVEDIIGIKEEKINSRIIYRRITPKAPAEEEASIEEEDNLQD